MRKQNPAGKVQVMRTPVQDLIKIRKQSFMARVHGVKADFSLPW